MSVLSVNKNNFEQLVNSDKPVLLDFFADGCAPCRLVSPIIEEIAAENPQYLVGKIDVALEFDLAQAFGIANIPTLVVMQKGQVVKTAVGAKRKDQILAMLRG